MTEDTTQHFVGNVGQKAIIEKDGKILVCRGAGDTLWEFPGGRLHIDETPYDGLRREVQEELGVSTSIDNPIAVTRSYHNKSKQWQVFIAYRCSLLNSEEPKADMTEVEEIR